MSHFRLAVDIGGTITDAVLFNENTGQVHTDKVLTTQNDLSQGFVSCFRRFRERSISDPEYIRYIVHGTTVATNALLERRGARVGLLSTQGFRDVLEIGRQIRHELYNLQTDKPVPLIPREWSLEIPERLNHNGEVLVPLDETAVISAVEYLHQENVDSFAVCFLHSYRNSRHERRTKELILSVLPDASVSLSVDIAPEIREYWRASTTVTNAYIAPAVTNYLEKVEKRLTANNILIKPHIMQSSGGLMAIDHAKEKPVLLLESGPAAGVIAGAFFAEVAGFKDVITFDMGGTTAKMGLVIGGQPRLEPEFEAGGLSGTGAGLSTASGYPILAPTIDLVEVGAGGGSIAWVDAGGLLRVGPRSAGATPGPVCYGLGGEKPTVTDANLILGRLNPNFFLGGEIELDLEASMTAMEENCANRLGISVTDAAMGVLDIANATMAEMIRLVTVQRGLDPREFSLVTTGGAGPAHANLLADELGIPTVVIPPSPGTASALGMLVSDMRHEFRVTQIQPLDSACIEEINKALTDFRERGCQALQSEGVNSERIYFECYLDLRYVGQSWNIPVGISDDLLTRNALDGTRDKFHRYHEQLYGYCVMDEPVEIVNIALRAVGIVPKPVLRKSENGCISSEHAKKGSRSVLFRGDQAIDCSVYDRYLLKRNNIVQGPAIIEEVDSTTVLLPGYQAEIVDYGVVVINQR